MGQTALYIRDSGSEVGLGIATFPSYTAATQEVPLAVGTFDSIHLELGLSNNELVYKGTSIYAYVTLSTGGEGTVTTALELVTHNSVIPNDDTVRWYSVDFTDGPYYLGATNPHVRVFVTQVPDGPSSLTSWHAETGWTGRKWYRVYGVTLDPPEKPINPSPSHIGTGITLNLTLGWDPGV